MVFSRQGQSGEEKWTYEANMLKREFMRLHIYWPHVPYIKKSRWYDSTSTQTSEEARAAWQCTRRIWLFKTSIISNQLLICILPALECGSCLWGAGKRRGEAGVWEEFELFWWQIGKR